MSEGIGQSVPRKEDGRFITGKGRYTDDIKQVGQTIDLLERQQSFRHPQSPNPSIFSATDCFITTSYAHTTTLRHHIGC